MIARPFAPRGWTVGGHRQTLLGYWRRRRLTWPHRVEDRVVPTADGARLLVRVTWQPGPRAGRPLLLLIHGLGGSDRAPYVVAAALHAWSRGWHVARMNLRGAGDSEAIYPRLYNAGLDGDLSATVWALARESLHMGAAGFSLGGNLLLLLLSRRRRELPDALRAAVAVSAPVDLSACARALETPRNRLYQHYFMRSLKAAYSRLQRLGPEVYAEGRERDARTIREYDEVITAPYGGYRSADEYYARSSAGPGIRDIERPTLLLSAEDDPMVPDGSVRAWPVPASGVVEREILPTGGHMGFVAPTIAPGRFWAAERLLAFLEEHMPAGLLVPRPPEELPRPTRP